MLHMQKQFQFSVMTRLQINWIHFSRTIWIWIILKFMNTWIIVKYMQEKYLVITFAPQKPEKF